MKRDFEILDGVDLKQHPHTLDLHNNFDFKDLNYNVVERWLSLQWERSNGDWVPKDTPTSLKVTFFEVSEFRFLPRDANTPFTEDDCVNQFGYWVDEEGWAKGVITTLTNQEPEPHWLTAIDFMSGAIIAVQALSAHAEIGL